MYIPIYLHTCMLQGQSPDIRPDNAQLVVGFACVCVCVCVCVCLCVCECVYPPG